MPIEFHCESCSRLLRVPEGSQGKQCQCPGCGKLLKIPQQTTAQTTTTTNLPAIAICIPCPKCHHELICDPSLIGTKGQCRSCKHIFLITEDPNAAGQTSVVPGWVFNCPKCDQLFEGNEGMRGRKGKCHVCGEVFQIEIKLAGNSVGLSSPTVASPSMTQSTTPAMMPVASKTSPGTQQSALQLPKTPSGTRATSPMASTPIKEAVKPAPLTAEPTSPAKSTIKAVPIQFACSKCQGILEVPADAVDQFTFCPYCDEQLTVPNKSTSKATHPAKSDRIVDIFDSTPGSETVSSGLEDLPPMDPIPFGMGHQHSMPRYRKSNGGTKYIVCGILTILCAVLSMAMEIYQLIVAVLLALTSAVRAESFAAGFVAIFIGLALIISIVQVVGGIAMIRRKGLALARTAAIINCLPCICINWPIGIWGAIITFGASAKNDFQ
jgi:DNA-directed RNA polymerase subunit M/transcription elongation factor TFIIS